MTSEPRFITARMETSLYRAILYGFSFVEYGRASVVILGSTPPLGERVPFHGVLRFLVLWFALVLRMADCLGIHGTSVILDSTLMCDSRGTSSYWKCFPHAARGHIGHHLRIGDIRSFYSDRVWEARARLVQRTLRHECKDSQGTTYGRRACGFKSRS